MTSPSAFRRFFRLPTRSASRIREDVDDELAFHFAMRTEELVAQGLTPDAAREQAGREFGDVRFTAQYCRAEDALRERDVRRTEWVRGAMQDARYAWRQLRHNPGFSIVAVLTLAVGIGATTAIFGAVDGVLLKPLPYGDVDRLVTLNEVDERLRQDEEGVSSGNFLDWEQRATSFEGMAVAEPYGMDLVGPDGPLYLRTWLVSADFFRVMGTTALLGRTLMPEDFVPGNHRVIVISEPLWRTQFGSDPSIHQKKFILEGEPYSVVGVMPPEFRYPAGRDVWAPKIFEEREKRDRVAAYLDAVARLKPGVTVEQARAELGAISRQLAAEYPRTNSYAGIKTVPLAERLTASVRPALLVLLGAVVFVLLIACANVANLLLTRAVRREREFAIRAALGAGRGRVLRQLGVESLLLGVLGGLGGVLLAYWGVSAIKGLAPANLPRVDDIAVDGRLLAFALAVSLGTAVLYGFVPAFRATTPQLHDALKAAGRSAAGRARNTMRGMLVVGQIAVAIVLIVGAGLLVRSFISLLQVDRGFRTDNVMALSVQAWGYYDTPAQRASFVEQTVERIAALRDVRAAGATTSLPLHESIGGETTVFARDDRPPPGPGEAPTVHAAVVSPGYFEALGIPLRGGRLFSGADRSDGPAVAIVSEALAERHFPGEDPVGKRITVGSGERATSLEIVGMVGNVRQNGLEREAASTLYFPFAQAPSGAIIFTVRTAGDPDRSLTAIKEEIWALNKAMPIAAVATVEGLLDDSLRERRFHLSLLAAFAVTALFLAAIGIYGVMSHATSERTREIGVRMALGASAADVLRMVMRQGGTLALVGLALGLLGAAVLTRLLGGMLFGVGPIDPLTFAGGSLLVLLLAAAATYVPAQRATRIEPTEALREAQ